MVSVSIVPIQRLMSSPGVMDAAEVSLKALRAPRRIVSPGGRMYLSPMSVTAELRCTAPLDWGSLAAFLSRRASRGVEAVVGDRYLRTLAVGGHAGWISVEPAEGGVLRMAISPSLLPVHGEVRAAARRAFDVDADMARIESCLGDLAAAHPGLRVPGTFDGFELAVRAILGQQVSVKGASTLSGRFAAAFGIPIDTPYAELTHLTPTPERVAAAAVEEITALGITGARARSIVALARAVADGLPITHGSDPAPTMARLTALPGIGDWTAQYIAMRALGAADAFPASDLGLLKALGETTPRGALARAERWRPWRAYAAMHLWRSLWGR
jgi:AraC family transcriptional regulator of adaptative response / DNA-3-methyladenine glycosylase II